MKKLNQTPVVRFPEFNKIWTTYTLEKVSSEIMYGMNSSAIPFDGQHKYIRITDIDEETRRFVPKPLTSPDGNIDDKFKLREGDILFTRTGASVGKSYLYKKDDGDVHFAGFLIKFSIVGADPNFVFYHTQRDEYKRWVKVMSMRSGQPGINAEEYRNLDIVLPSLKEQTMISRFLASIDAKIQQLQKKKDLLERYKKGVMQRIFNQVIRFKDDEGKDYPSLERKKLAEISHKKSSNISANELEQSSGDFIIYGATGILKRVDFFREERPFISIVKDGAGVGRVLLCEKKSSVLGTLDVILNSTDVDLYYLYLTLQNIDFTKYITGSTIPHIYYKDYSKEMVFVPSIQEQRKIANFVSAVEDRIKLVEQQLDQTRQFKKGLLQRMFV